MFLRRLYKDLVLEIIKFAFRDLTKVPTKKNHKSVERQKKSARIFFEHGTCEIYAKGIGVEPECMMKKYKEVLYERE